ncbi:MAG: ASCH domain-containing protein [Crocosphaera sp.]|nr:ASCH domain-containing protein [Crocosphaera sp.]
MTNLLTVEKDIDAIETIIEEAAQEGITLDSIDARQIIEQERHHSASFDDLSHLLRVQYCEKIVVYFDHPSQSKIKMAQDYYDLQEGRVKFLTYIGGHSKDELKQIIKKTKAPRYQIRKAKRIPSFPLELKVGGIPFATMKALVNQYEKSQNKAKAISLHQPWASLIALGFKHFETRSWGTKYRGKLVICAAKKNSKQQRLDYEDLASILGIDLTQNPWESLPLGKAIAIVDLVDCIKMTPEFISAQSESEQLCGHWETGRFAWQLDDIKPIFPPIPIKGQQGLWDVSLPFLS